MWVRDRSSTGWPRTRSSERQQERWKQETSTSSSVPGVGKSEHWATALTRTGRKIFDKALPNDEARLRVLCEKLADHGSLLVVARPARHHRGPGWSTMPSWRPLLPGPPQLSSNAPVRPGLTPSSTRHGCRRHAAWAQTIVEALGQQTVTVAGTHAAAVVLPHLARQLIAPRAQRADVAAH